MQALPNPVQTPLQARSRATMAKIMDAAAEILEARTFEQLTVSEVVRAAGTSVGAFYGRFKDKDGLLQSLDERFFAEFGIEVEALLRPGRWDEASLSLPIIEATRMLVSVYSRNRGVLRSLNLAARRGGDPRFVERERRAWAELFPRLQALLLSKRESIRHPDPALATWFGFRQLFFAMRETILWEAPGQGPVVDGSILVDELSRAYLAYLGTDR